MVGHPYSEGASSQDKDFILWRYCLSSLSSDEILISYASPAFHLACTRLMVIGIPWKVVQLTLPFPSMTKYISCPLLGIQHLHTNHTLNVLARISRSFLTLTLDHVLKVAIIVLLHLSILHMQQGLWNYICCCQVQLPLVSLSQKFPLDEERFQTYFIKLATNID